MKKIKVLVDLIPMTEKVNLFTNELKGFRDNFDVSVMEEEATSLIEALSELKQVLLTTPITN